MEKTRLRKVLGVLMIVLGLVQAGFGTTQGEPVYAALGVGYATIGVTYLRFEGYAAER